MNRYADSTAIAAHLTNAPAPVGLFTPESEEAVIAAALSSPGACDDAFERLTPEHFASGFNPAIWGAVLNLYRSGQHPSPALVRDRIGSNPAFESWGGIGKLETLTEIGSVRGLASHVAAVGDRAERRAIRQLTDTVSDRAGDTSTGDASDLLGELEHGAAEIAKRSVTADRWLPAGQMVRSAIQYARTRSGRIDHSFGTASVDRYIGGLNAGEVTLLAARPGMGKTVAAQTIAKANAAAGRGVPFFSLEMDAHPLGLRLATDLAFDRAAERYMGVTSNPTADRALKNEILPEQWDRLEHAASIVERWPLKIDTRPGLTLAQIEAAARRAYRQWEREGIKPGPLIIDHLGKVRPSKDRKGNKHAEVADVSNGVAEMAKRLGVPVVALVQLNRGVEGRDDKRPVLSDLRQAGELEEDARQVVFIYRPEYYLREPTDQEVFEAKTKRMTELRAVENQMYWIVEKNSHGPRGQVKTFCEIACSAIRDWEV